MSAERVVRNFGSDKTHVADLDLRYVRWATVFGKDYQKPDTATRAACGVAINDGVVMRPGTKVRCSPCRHITGTTVAPYLGDP